MGCAGALLVALTGASAQLPTYARERDACIVPHFDNGRSQVVHLRGSGGIELPCTEADCPFASLGADDVVRFDVLFRDRVDPARFTLWAGCLTCDPAVAVDEAHASPLPVAYQGKEVEPFLQIGYERALSVVHRSVNASLLRPERCPAQSFGVRLATNALATGTADEDLRWSVVVGRYRTYTPAELAAMPLHLTNLHGEAWNRAGFTLPLVVVLVVVLGLGIDWLQRVYRVGWRLPSVLDDPHSARAWLYHAAEVAFVSAAIEKGIHLLIAQAGEGEVHSGLFLGLFVGIFAVELGPLVITFVAWSGMYETNACACGAPACGAVQVAVGTGLLFCLGSGLWVGPLAIACAGLLQLAEACTAPRLKATAEARTELARVVAQEGPL